MKEEEIIKTIKKNFETDLRKKLNPLYDIEQSVHKDTLNELKELFEAVGVFAIQKTKEKMIEDIEKGIWQSILKN